MHLSGGHGPHDKRSHSDDVARTVLTRTLKAILVAALGVVIAGLGAGCSGGNSPSSEPTTSTTTTTTKVTATSSSAPVSAAPDAATPGDIPDTVAFIGYTNAAGGYTFVRPEGWAQTQQGPAVSFTDKYNTISAMVASGTSQPTVASARSADVPALKASQPAFELLNVVPVMLPAGPGVLITYKRNSQANAVTNKSVRQLVQRYEIAGVNKAIVLELAGAVGADNVDPYTKVSQSLRLS